MMEERKRDIVFQFIISISFCIIGILCRCSVLTFVLGFVSFYKMIEYVIETY